MFGFLKTGTRLTALERLVRKLDEAERAHGAMVDARLAQIAEHVARHPTAKDLRELRQAVRALAGRDERQVFDEIERIAASGRPIIVGPWTGELGFELLYWIPFVEWVRRQWNIAPERQIVVSRGGVASWYGVSEANYSDLFSVMSPDEFKKALGEEKRKQRSVSELDRRLVDTVIRQRGVVESDLLHPGLMFRLFAPFWSDEAGYARIDQYTRYRLFEAWPDFTKNEKPGQASLPADYVAVRFYFSECFPDTPENRGFAQTVVTSLAERTAVVLLNPGFSVDEHQDWAPSAGGRLHTITDRTRPDRNLAVQSAVISGARAFVGTYGGYAYLAPMYRVPAVAFFSRPTFKRHHLYAAARAFDQAGAAALSVLDVAQAPVVQSTFGAFAAAHPGLPERLSGVPSDLPERLGGVPSVTAVLPTRP
jgi:hypothetical protein